MKQTAVEWLVEQICTSDMSNFIFHQEIKQAKAMEKEQMGYTEEQAKQIWKAGQEYWRTSGGSVTFEELTQRFTSEQPHHETQNP